MMGSVNYKTRTEKKKEKIELEKILIGSIFYYGTYDIDVREKVAGLEISWRQFIDKRHRAIWRTFEALDLKSVEERKEIIESELYAAAGRIDPSVIGTGDDPVKGDPGSGARRRYDVKLIKGSMMLAWFERELEAVGALKVAGGKIYLRELAEKYGGLLADPVQTAEDLFGKREEA
jgi:hypothetical protein